MNATQAAYAELERIDYARSRAGGKRVAQAMRRPGATVEEKPAYESPQAPICVTVRDKKGRVVACCSKRDLTRWRANPK